MCLSRFPFYNIVGVISHQFRVVFISASLFFLEHLSFDIQCFYRHVGRFLDFFLRSFLFLFSSSFLKKKKKDLMMFV